MIVVRTSMISGITREMDLPISEEQLKNYRDGVLIQNAFPNLSADQREFFMTGITAEEWETLKEDEEDDEQAF